MLRGFNNEFVSFKRGDSSRCGNHMLYKFHPVALFGPEHSDAVEQRDSGCYKGNSGQCWDEVGVERGVGVETAIYLAGEPKYGVRIDLRFDTGVLKDFHNSGIGMSAF